MPRSKARSGGHWLRHRCYACGHTLAFAATGCPQCSEHFDDRPDPKRWPARCQCKRCNPATEGAPNAA